jgi:DNA-binding NarL/FixJ family response regulator
VTLSPRELEVARLVAADLPDKAIARTLLLSIHTVREYLRRIGWKLNAEESVRARRRTITRWVELHDRAA